MNANTITCLSEIAYRIFDEGQIVEYVIAKGLNKK